MNELVATAMAHSTCGMRFKGQLNTSLRKQAVNLIPFPRMKFLIDSLTPLLPDSERKKKYCVQEAIVDLRDRPSYLCSFGPPINKFNRRNPIDNRILAASVIFRGNISSYEA
jgi:tubulin beta